MHRARSTQALAGKGLPPGEHLVDAGYVDAELLVRSREEHGIDLVGPPRRERELAGQGRGRPTASSRFAVDWERGAGALPAGQAVLGLEPPGRPRRQPYVSVQFRTADCRACPARPVHAGQAQARHLKLQPRAEHEALQAARERLATKEGRRLYARRAGIEGTLSQGVRAFGLRRAATAAWPRPTCSTWRPRPRSTSTGSRAWFRATRAPRPAPRASPRSPPEPIRQQYP